MTTDNFNALVEQVKLINNKVDTLSDSVANLDLKYSKIKYLSKLIDVNISYPAENDVLVYDKTGKWKNAQYDEIGLSYGEGGESNIYVIGINDPTSPTNENVYAAARTLEDFVSSKNDDDVWGNLTFYSHNEDNPHATKIFVDEITSRTFNSNTVTGSGFIYQIKKDGTSYIEVDELAVRKAAVFNTLNIKKIDSVGGSLIVSVASNTITEVEISNLVYDDTAQDVWRCHYNSKDSMTGETIMTDFQPGDIAKVQSFNIADTGDNEGVKNHYYCGRVLGVGNGWIDLSLTDVDSSTTEPPKAGDALVQFGNYKDVSRQNIITISAYDNNAPSIMLYQGVNSYDLTNKSIIEMGYDRGLDLDQGYFNVYGRMYIGTKPNSLKESYVKYDPTIDNGDGSYGRVLVKADIIVEGTDGDKTLITGNHITTELIEASEVVANAGTISNSLSVGDYFKVDSSGNLTAINAYLTNATLTGTFSNKGCTLNSDGSGSFANGLLSWDTSGQIIANNLSINKVSIKSNDGYYTTNIMPEDYADIAIHDNNRNVDVIRLSGFRETSGTPPSVQIREPYAYYKDTIILPGRIIVNDFSSTTANVNAQLTLLPNKIQIMENSSLYDGLTTEVLLLTGSSSMDGWRVTGAYSLKFKGGILYSITRVSA